VKGVCQREVLSPLLIGDANRLGSACDDVKEISSAHPNQSDFLLQFICSEKGQ
jgi:hypothetical protein